MKTLPFREFEVETRAQFGGNPGYATYKAQTKADAIKKARRWYNDYCKDSSDGRITYRVVAIDGEAC